jgi:uncharacterized MAPEG superfamily protein
MSPHVAYLLASAGLAWLLHVSASLLHSRGWTWPGMLLAFGNREAMPEPSAFVGRAKRAAVNMGENLPLLCAVLLAAHLAEAPAAPLDLGAAIFFWARVAHAVIYLAGVAWLRTAAWGVSLVGLLIIGLAAMGA